MRRRHLLCVGALIACAGALCRSADIQPPSVSISSPQAGATISNMTFVSVTATDDVGVASVTLKVDGADIRAPLTNAPFVCALNTGQLPNGMHSLMAVATDSAGNSTRSPLVSITVNNPPAYRLGTGPFMVEDLGNVLSVNTEERQTFFQLSNDTHLLLYYIADYGVSPLQILDVNLSQGTARLTNGVLGRPGVYGAVLYPNGKIYLSTGEASGKGYFMEYDPTTGATRQIAQLSDTGGYFSEIGDDGWIYIGEDTHGRVDRYNPNTDTFERLGQMDVNYTGNNQFAYSLGADSRFLYVGLAQSPWYLSVYDTQTTNTTLYWATNGDAHGRVLHGTNGLWYYQRNDASNVVTWYELTSGVPVMISPPSGLLLQQQRGSVVDDQAFGYLMGYEINLDAALPDSSSNYATIRWRIVGATNWQSVGIGGFHLAPSSVSRLYPWDSTRLLAFSSFYGPVILWDINSHLTTKLGYPQNNLYDAIFGQGVAYFSGYYKALLRYDPGQLWTLRLSTGNKSNTNINPYQTSLAIATHELFTTWGADGLVYVGAWYERGSTGGELGWYDPATGTNGSLRTPFLDYKPSDLKPALGGTKLVYASASSNLFVFDVATKSIERTIVPLRGVNMDKVVEVAPGIMFGAAGSNVFKVNITTGSLIYSNTLPGSAFGESITYYNRRLVLGPDGYLWMFRWYRDAPVPFNRTTLYRIDPADGSYSAIVTNTFSSYGENNPMFNGGDMYWYGGSTLYRVRNVLVSSRPQGASDLKVLSSY